MYKKIKKSKKIITNINNQQTSQFINFYKNNNIIKLNEYKLEITESQLLVEHLLLKDLVNQKEHDLNFLLFIIENLLDIVTSIKIDNNINKLIHTILYILEKKSDPKFILFRIRVLDKLINNKLYIPIFSFYLEIIDQIIGLDILNNSNKSIENKNIDYINRVKIDQKILKSSEFCEYVINKSIKSLLKYLNKFSTNISFPEVSKPIIEKLIKYKQLEIIQKTIDLIIKQSKYIENRRTGIETLSIDDRKKFENGVNSMNLE